MKVYSTGVGGVLRLHEGDSLGASIEKAMAESYARNASIDLGLGSLAEVEFGVLPKQGPHKRFRVEGPVELVFLSGLVVGEGATGPYTSHLHVAVAGADGVMRGGHMFLATVGAAAEVGFSVIQDSRLKRVHDKARQLDLLDGGAPPHS